MKRSVKLFAAVAASTIATACAAVVGLDKDYFDCGEGPCTDSSMGNDVGDRADAAKADANKIDSALPDDDAACRGELADGGTGSFERTAWSTFPLGPHDGGERLRVSPQSSLIVEDVVTGLKWQRYASPENRRLSLVPDSGEPIMSANEYCQRLTLATITGWRVPSKTELLSLLDYERDPAFLSATLFPDAGANPNFNYWTSTYASPDAGEVWIVNFSDGYFTTTAWDRFGQDNGVRCVK